MGFGRPENLLIDKSYRWFLRKIKEAMLIHKLKPGWDVVFYLPSHDFSPIFYVFESAQD